MNFLSQFFSILNIEQIEHSVLRNYQELPTSTGGSDLDILINSQDKFKVISILKKLSKENGGGIISIIPSPFCPRICLLGCHEAGWGLMIDLHIDKIMYRDYTIISNSCIWKNTFHFNKEVMALNSKADTLIGLFKELLNNEHCQSKYYENFQRLALEKQFINDLFSDIHKPKLGEFLLEYKNIPYSKTVIQQLVSRLNIEFPKSRFSFFKHIKKILRLFNQPGFTIAFLGTDGSGKSTLIQNIKPALNSAFHKAVYYEHMRPNKFPSIAKLLGKKEHFDGPVTNPHESKPSGSLGSLVRWSYYMLDYTLGFYLKVYPKKSIRSCVWIFDRYYYDYLIDPRRSRINLPQWLFKLGQMLIPEPDIIICLGTDAKAIHQRKPELSLEEVERQVLALRDFSMTHKNALWIDTGESIHISSQKTLDAISKIMSTRFESVKVF